MLLLDSVSSPITKRVYKMALDEFMGWFQEAPRPGFTKATVSAWRVSLEERRLGSSSIIVRMSAIRKLAAEAADNGLLAPELAAGISRVKSAKTQGVRTGNWLSQRQAQALLSAPDIATLRGLRDRASVTCLALPPPDLDGPVARFSQASATATQCLQKAPSVPRGQSHE
jgi:site-specific recombinase XerD